MIPPESLIVMNRIFITKKDILFRTAQMYENERLCSGNFYKPNDTICQVLSQNSYDILHDLIPAFDP